MIPTLSTAQGKSLPHACGGYINPTHGPHDLHIHSLKHIVGALIQERNKAEEAHMAARSRAAAGDRRVYEEFVPSHELRQAEGPFPTLVVELPGFKKEQIRVQIDNYGRLRISGERPLADNRWSRFSQDFQAPDTCNVSEVRAKFENEVLEVTLPKLITEPRLPQPRPPAQPPQKPMETQKPTTEPKPSTAPEDTKLKAPVEPNGAAKKQPEEKKSEQIEEKKDSRKVEETEEDRSKDKKKQEEKVAAGVIEEGEKGEGDAAVTGAEQKMESAPEQAATGGVRNGVEKLKLKVGELALGFYKPRHLMVNVVVAAVVLVGVGMYVYYKLIS